MISVIQMRRRKGQHYHVRMGVTVPGKELVVNREPADDTAIDIPRAESKHDVKTHTL